MATAIIRTTFLTMLLAQPFCNGNDAETCGQVAAPWTLPRNNSFQCGVSIEDDSADEQLALLQVELHVGKNSSRDAALSTPLGQHATQKKSVRRDEFGSLHSCFANDSFKHCMLSFLSLPLGIVSGDTPLTLGLISQDAKRAGSVSAGPVFVLGAIFVVAVIAGILLLDCFSDFSGDSEFDKSKEAPGNSPLHYQRQLPHKSPVPSDSHLPHKAVGYGQFGSPKPPPSSGAVGSPMVSSSPFPSQQMPLRDPGQQGNPAQMVLERATNMAAGAPGALQKSPLLGQQQSLPGTSNASRPLGEAISNLSNPGHREVFLNAGVSAICSSMILLNMEASLTIPMREIVGAAAQKIEKLEILSLQGKTMLNARVDTTPEDGRKSFVISSVKGNLPRVYVRPRGRGEPFDVIGPKGDVYGTLAHSGDSSAVLSHRNQPILKISKVNDLPNLEMTATTMDGMKLGYAAPHGNDSWKLTVGKGVDAVLLCACMMGLCLFGREY